jgi:hypothetical protein
MRAASETEMIGLFLIFLEMSIQLRSAEIEALLIISSQLVLKMGDNVGERRQSEVMKSMDILTNARVS